MSRNRSRNDIRVPLPDDLAEHLAELRVAYGDDEEPALIRSDGRRVNTWRKGYPYPERLSRDDYDRTKRQLQIGLLTLQRCLKTEGRNTTRRRSATSLR